MAAQRRISAAALSVAAALALVLLCVALRPSAAPGGLESVSARMAGARASLMKEPQATGEAGSAEK